MTQFFYTFEKITEGNNWLSDRWSILSQTALKGKTLQAFDSLSFDESQDSEILKAVVLRAYELRPEAYRQRFCNCMKQPDETYCDFSDEF